MDHDVVVPSGSLTFLAGISPMKNDCRKTIAMYFETTDFWVAKFGQGECILLDTLTNTSSHSWARHFDPSDESAS